MNTPWLPTACFLLGSVTGWVAERMIAPAPSPAGEYPVAVVQPAETHMPPPSIQYRKSAMAAPAVGGEDGPHASDPGTPAADPHEPGIASGRAAESRIPSKDIVHVQVTGPVPPELWYRLNVLLLPEGGNSLNGRGPDEHGRWTFDTCPSGDYELMLRVDQRPNYYTVADMKPVRIGPGCTDLAIECPPLYDLTIVVPDLDKPATLLLKQPDDRKFTAIWTEIVATSGRVTIPHLPAGTYQVSMAGEAFRSWRATITLPSATEIVLRPPVQKETR